MAALSQHPTIYRLVKYRVKLYVVDAVQWFKDGDDPRVHFTKESSRVWIKCDPKEGKRAVFHNPKSNWWDEINPGEWLVAEEDGSLSKMTDIVFRQTFELHQ